MEHIVTFRLTDTQIKSLEQLLDEFNATVKRIQENEPEREKVMAERQAETRLLLEQAHKDLDAIREINARQQRMIWEK